MMTAYLIFQTLPSSASSPFLPFWPSFWPSRISCQEWAMAGDGGRWRAMAGDGDGDGDRIAGKDSVGWR